MHNNNSEDYLYKELLKTYVRRKFGREVKYSKDCRVLSEHVFQATGRQLSLSTIKRFFGLIQSPFHPSKYTLDTFSGYLGLEKWERFVEAKKDEAHNHSGEDNADLLLESFETVTRASCISLSRKVRYSPDTFIHRSFASNFFEKFLQSGKTASVLVAPTGHGKSAILLQWMKTFFSGNDRRFKNDVVCLMDGGIFFTFYSQAQENELLIQLLDFDIKTIQKLYEKQKKNPQKVRYFLIIDDVDRVFSVREKYYLFVENIMRLIMLYKENPWLKIILTCRPENLDVFDAFIINNPLLADAFYKIKFLQENQNEKVNIPLFTGNELLQAFGKYKNKRTYFRLSLHYPDLLNLIKIPQFFSFFIHGDSSTMEGIKEVDFLNRLIHHFYCSQPFAEEKHQLINKYFNLCSHTKSCTNIKKETLLEDVECLLAYKELIKAGLFFEEMDSFNQTDVQLHVKISNPEIFEFLLARTLVGERGLNLKLINWVFDKYSDVIQLQYAILKWVIKIAFFEGNASFLRQLHQFMERQLSISGQLGQTTVPGALIAVQSAFTECFRTNPVVTEVVLPEFARSKLGQELYFEESFDMDNLIYFPENSLMSYARNNTSTDGKMIFHFVRFIKGFYSSDMKSCSKEFNRIGQIDYGELNLPLSLGYYFSSWFLYAWLNNFQKREDMLKKFLKTSETLRLKSIPSLRFHPGFEFFVLYHLNVCNYFKEFRIAAEHIFRTQHSNERESSGFYQFFRLCYARSLLHTGEQTKALDIYRQITSNDYPFHLKHFMQINVNLARYDFLEHQNKTAEALTLLQETKLLANQMGYKYYVQKTEELEYNLINANSDLSS